MRAAAHYFLIQRRRSPSAHLVRRKGGTHCSDLYYGCSAVPFPAPNRLFLRRIRPHQQPGGSSYFLSERQRSPSRHLWRVMVERLVGFHFHRLFLASLSEIVSAWFVTIVSLCGRSIVRAVANIFPDPTSAFTLGALCAP